MFERHPRLGIEIARLAASEAALMEIHLSTIGRRSAESRVAYLLAELYTRLRQRKLTTDNTCVLPLTQEHLADALGLSTVHVSRMLRVLSDDGLARLDRGHLTILDLTGLIQRARDRRRAGFPAARRCSEPPVSRRKLLSRFAPRVTSIPAWKILGCCGIRILAGD